MSIFKHVAMNKPQHNTFDLSHTRKFSGSMGNLIPCFIAETVPNEIFKINTSQLVRLAPMVAPVMHRFTIYTHFFFVPNRILWKGWEDFINGGTTGEEAPVFPTVQDGVGYQGGVGSLPDYLGIPVTQPSVGNHSSIPFAAYQKIWYEYYRDQNLQDDNALDFLEEEPLEDGVQLDGRTAVLTQIRNRAWQHDYFTASLPWTQRGAEATIPLGDEIPITYVPNTGTQLVRNQAGGSLPGGGPIGRAGGDILVDLSANVGANLDLNNTHIADLSQATVASINDLRRAFRLQEWLEINARGGARYNETIKVHFGISPGDARLQRPEFLGGSSTPLVISEVLQTSSTQAEPTPQGNLAGYGVSVGGKNITSYKTREHGYIIGIMSIMPKSAYDQGIAKHWFKFDKFDYFWKSFANIGEQPVLNKELFVTGDPVNDEDTFGYVPRYAEYKYIPSTVHGEFRGSLDFWHASRRFNNPPRLNESFVTMQSGEVDRIFAVANQEQFYVQMHHNVKARRPMPYFGTPTI